MTTPSLDALLKIASLRERFESYVMPEPNSGCWLWIGPLNGKGYGRLWLAGNWRKRTMGAHRYSYLMARGPIPEGLVLDHLCRVPCCVNPDHLEPVTIRENAIRGVGPVVSRAYWAARTHCRKGHPVTPENIKIRGSTGERICKVCVKIARSRPEVKAVARLNERAYQALPHRRAHKNAQERERRRLAKEAAHV